MKILAFALLFALVFVGVAAHQLEQRGLLARETLDMFLGADEGEAKGTLITPEPVGLAASINESKQELRDQAKGIELLNERLEAQRRELDEQRAAVERRIEDLVDEEKKLAAKRSEELGLEPGAMSEEQTRLIKMYGSMSPDDAAALLDRMPDETVATMLLQMRDRQAAQIMGALDKGKAVEVGKLLWTGGEESPASQPAEPAATP